MDRRKASLTNFHHLKLRWEAWLRAEFGGSATVISRARGVSRQTATAWLNGAEPSAWHLFCALMEYPGARAAILGEPE